MKDTVGNGGEFAVLGHGTVWFELNLQLQTLRDGLILMVNPRVPSQWRVKRKAPRWVTAELP